MCKNLYCTILLFFNFCFFAQNDNLVVSKIDSTFFYTESAIKYKDIKIFDKALENANKSILYAQKINNPTEIANGHFILASVYIDLKRFDEAIEKLIRSVSILNSLKPSSNLALSYYTLGLCYMQKENFTKAESYFEKAKSIYENIDLLNAMSIVNLQKAMIYKEKKKYDIAEQLFTDIIAIPDNDDVFLTKFDALYHLGEMKITSKKYNLALHYLKQASEICYKTNNLEQQVAISKILSELYEKMSLTDNSLKLLKTYTKLKDSLESISTNEKISVESKQFKVGEIMRSMEKMDKEKKIQERAGKFGKLINILSIALITILSLLSLSLYKNNIIRNKSNELLREKNNELELAKERIEKASQARSEFLSTVSHELRTPLNAINGISHILLEDEPKESQIEYLKSLKFSGNYLLTYINEILEINRIESNNIEVEKISFNVRELLFNIQNSLKEQASINNNDFILEIDSEIPDVLIGDPTKLSQIFINLINNALKFTQNGTISAIAKLRIKDSESCSINFNVEDTGIGIPKEKLESIFDSFSQGSVEINRKYGGTGLGLTIVKRLLILMGGKITLESEVGVGSNFKFSLDYKIGNESDLVNDYIIIDEKVFIGKKILLVEDNKINQMITKKILENKGIVCEICETGEDAIEKTQNNKYDLVLMDVHLPGINGTIATEEIRKFDAKTPIIALTAISLNENREMLLSFGMTDVITKPFNPDNFYKTIETHLTLTSSTV
jgi:signal transduction histidine kinase/ActR/RegA family two-component response regulator